MRNDEGRAGRIGAGPVTEQTPERIAEIRQRIGYCRKFVRDGHNVEDAKDIAFLMSQFDALTATLAHLTRDEVAAPDSQGEGGTSPLTPLPGAAAWLDELEDCVIEGGRLDRPHAETVLRAFAANQRRRAEATLARVKAPDHDAMLRKISGALRSCIDAHGPITKVLIHSAAKRVWKQLDAALVDPPVSSSTETKT